MAKKQKSKQKVILTHHSKKRAKQRAGLSKNQAVVMSDRALEDGIQHSDTKGSLHKWMDAEYLKYETANNCRLYANQLFIFHNKTLITVLNAPLIYEQNLLDYVKTVKIYLTYKKNRLKYKSNTTNIFTQEVIDYINKDIKYFLATLDYGNSLPYTYLGLSAGRYEIKFEYHNNKLNSEIKEKISRYVSDNFGMQPLFYKTTYLEDKTFDLSILYKHGFESKYKLEPLNNEITLFNNVFTIKKEADDVFTITAKDEVFNEDGTIINTFTICRQDYVRHIKYYISTVRFVEVIFRLSLGE